jgi:hypothetical protein
MDDYLSAVTPTQGARMLIHDRQEIPFPAQNGIDLSPLVETAVVVKRVRSNTVDIVQLMR